MRLAALLRAAEAIHLERETAEDLRFLLGEGSPLGGARPKSAVRRDDGGLAIAKFPKLDDTRDIGAGETLALQLARNAGIRTAESQRVAIRSSSVTVIARFDREGGQRIPFLSAASLLGLESSSPGSYTLMADAIRRFGDAVTEDLIELWRRMVFSLLASNCDDHLRNQGFLMRKPGNSCEAAGGSRSGLEDLRSFIWGECGKPFGSGRSHRVSPCGDCGRDLHNSRAATD